MNISQKLDELAVLDQSIANHQKTVKERRNILDAERDMLIASVLTDEQKIQMEEIKAEFSSKYATLDDDTDLKDLDRDARILADEIREQTLKAKETVKGENSTYQMVYIPEKTKEITHVKVDELKGMAKLMPKLKDLFFVTEEFTPASTSLRKK